MTIIAKPVLDDREYRRVVLDNQMEVLVIHDHTTDSAAAALSVGVGSYHDPVDLPGLAHFLEHLLFMGTEKYPNDSEYSQFLNEHGGKSNAFTASEQINFHFEVSWPHLKGALDRFAQFFIAPLFSESCKSREIMAVDSENKRNLQNDIWRFFQLEKSQVNPDHPHVRFSTGNYETLGLTPEKQGIDVRMRLIEWYKENFTASIMKLVVIGHESLDELEEMVRECFSSVPNSKTGLSNGTTFYEGIPLFNPEHCGLLIKARPVMDMNYFEIKFCIPDQQFRYETQPYLYYVNLLGHESKGSLLYYLNQKGWANEVSAVISHICKGTDNLYVNIELTNEGLDHWVEILEALFGYIEMLKEAGPQRWIFDEQKKISEAMFLYRQKGRPMAFSSSLAQILHRPIPRERILNYSVVTRYDEKELRDFVDFLAPEKCQVTLASKKFDNLDQRERWYGTEHSINKLPNLTPLRTSDLHLPHKNEFLPTNFDLVKEPNGPIVKQSRPRLLVNTDELRLWHKLDDQFKVPKGHIFLKVINSKTSSSAWSIRVTDLFTAMINDLLVDHAYYAGVADVHMSLTTVQDGIEIEVGGFSEKLEKLLDLIMITLYEGNLSKDRFEIIKEQQKRQLNNLALAQPDSQRTIQTGYLLLQNLYQLSDRIDALESIQFDDVVRFVEFFRKTKFGLEMLVTGNFNSLQARSIASNVKNIMQKSSGSKLDGKISEQYSTNHYRNTSYLLKQGTAYYREVKLADPDNVNSALLLGFQFGEVNTKLFATLSVLSQLLKEATFTQLRTKEQLGYIVLSTHSQTRSTLWFNFFLQSEETTKYLEDRVENYIVRVAKPLLESMSDAEYQKHINALNSEFLEADKNMTDESNKFWAYINSGFYDFGRRRELAQTVLQIKKSEVLEAFDQFLVNPETRSRFALHLQSHKHKKLEPEVALARSVGQLVTERKINVTSAQIQQFMMECQGISPQEAMQKLGIKLVTEHGLSGAAAQEFIASVIQRSQQMIMGPLAGETAKPIGQKIDSLPEYYKQLDLAKMAKPVEPLDNFTSYEDGSKL